VKTTIAQSIPVKLGHLSSPARKRTHYLFAVDEPQARGAATAPPRSRPPRESRSGERRGATGPTRSERERRFRQRAIPLIVVAAIAFVVGAIMAAGSPEQDRAERFAQAWADQDFAVMYDELGDSTKSNYSLQQFTSAYQEAQSASTTTAIDPGEAEGPEEQDGVDVVTVDVGVETRLFGDVDGEVQIPLDGDKLGWAPHATFPGLQPGERVGRRLELDRRAPILAADGTPLAEGQASRNSPLGSDAIDVAGEVGTPDAARMKKLSEEGYPTDHSSGISGLELAFNSRLAGSPGGELLAVPEDTPLPDVPKSVDGRVLATAETEAGKSVKTTIDPELQQLTVGALAGRSGGVVVLDARKGSIKALAGSAFSSPQPPGSTFKVVTTTAALEEDKVKLDETFPVVSEINAGGRVISNAHDELCGGTFVESFAHSCNTVFAPLGVEVGEEKLVEVAERYGYNEPPSIYDEDALKTVELPGPEIPEDPGDDVDLAASAIGQGEVLATPLNMASIAQTVANRGVRSPTPLVSNPELQSDQEDVKVTSPEDAKVLRYLMEQVVKQGTGTAAALPNVTVAGKTGTAELGPDPTASTAPGEEPPQILDAWFIAFAPSEKPRLAVGVMLIDAGADGGEVAAPIAHEILAAAL
jgi:peptidoglycan glycosyltransferase